MTHKLVKITADEDGFNVEKQDRVWCLSIVAGGSPMCFCNGQVYGYGEGDAEYETKTVARGAITCLNCIEKIADIKAVRL